MADLKRAVTIDLDKPRHLRYDLNALVAIEERLGVGIDKLADLDLKTKTTLVMLWGGLLHESPDLAEKEVGALVDMDNLPYIQEKIAEAVAGAGIPGNAAGPKVGSGKKPRH